MKRSMMATMFLLFIFSSLNVFGGSIEQKLNVEEKLQTIHVQSFEELYSEDGVVIQVAETNSNQKMVNRGVPRGSDGSFKSYMSYKAITNKESKQYQLQTECWTDGFGFRRWGDYYCVAMGTAYSDVIGTKFVITFDTGVQIKVILSDVKQDRHTDSTNRFVPKNGNICEFLVDTNKLSKVALRMGNVSYGCEDLKGGIIKIEEILD